MPTVGVKSLNWDLINSKYNIYILLKERIIKNLYGPPFAEGLDIRLVRRPWAVPTQPSPTVSVLRSVWDCRPRRVVRSVGRGRAGLVAESAAGEHDQGGWSAVRRVRSGRSDGPAVPSAASVRPSSGPTRGQPTHRPRVPSSGTSPVASARTTADRVVSSGESLHKTPQLLVRYLFCYRFESNRQN